MSNGKRNILIFSIFLQIAAQMLMTSGLSVIAANMLAELNGFAVFGMIFTLANLTTAIFNPLGGRLGEIMNKRTLLIIASICNLIEYGLGGFSPNIGVTLATRVIGGIGTGLIIVIGLSMIADLFPASKRPLYMGIYGTFMAGAVCLGSLVAGLIIDNTTWRVFPLIAFAVGIISFIGILISCPSVNFKTEGVKLDLPGFISIAICMGVLVYWLGVAGNNFAWTSAPSIICAVVVVISFIVFVIVERKAGDSAIMPVKLLKNKYVAVGVVGAVLISVGNLAISVFIPNVTQSIMQMSGTMSGLILTISGVIAFVLGFPLGAWIAKKGHIKWFAAAGALLQGVALVIASTIKPTGDPWTIVLGVGIAFGIGNGINNSINVSIVQRYLPADKAGLATAAVMFAQQATSSIGVAILNIFPQIITDPVKAFSVVFLIGAACAVAQILVILITLSKEKN